MIPRLLVVALFASACSKKDEAKHAPPVAAPSPADAAAPAAAAAPTWYRVTLGPPSEPVGFFVALPADRATGTATIQSGADRLDAAVRRDGDAVRVELPLYQTALVFEPTATGFGGRFEVTSKTWGASSLPLAASPVAAPDPAHLDLAPAGAPLDLEARTVWRVAMADAGLARLELDEVAPGSFRGVIEFANGDVVVLGGNGADATLVLAGFDGAYPSRLHLTLDAARKTGAGEWVTGQKLDWRQKVTARAATDVALVAPTAKAGTPIALPQLAPFAGKPVVVELGGSWCPTCRNAVPVMRALHDAYAARGLAIVTLLFELTDDPDTNREHAELFAKTYQIPWPVVAVDGEPDEIASKFPAGLGEINFSSFPITLFLTADHRLAAMHAGFPAEAAGAAYDRTVAAYRANVERIVQPPSAP